MSTFPGIVVLAVSAIALFAGNSPSLADPATHTRVCVAASDTIMRCEDLLPNGENLNPANPVTEIEGYRDGCGGSETCDLSRHPQDKVAAQSGAGSVPDGALPAYVPPNCSETGSCYGDLSARTGRPKTEFVQGYTRKNGTPVGSYYRSPKK